uniref:C2H2-type domain-containing protein n=1 Tax=Nothobranchius kuhntae TaxID=321403 RepID=A0A1A8JH19_NOTKU
MMPPVQHLRDFIGERLTAVATEIFTEFEKTIVRYEEELARSRRLMVISWKPEKDVHRLGLQQEHDPTTELILTDQEWNSSLDLEEPRSPQIKDDHKELDPESPQIQEKHQEEPLQLKQETDPFLVTVLDEESEHSEAEPEGGQPSSQSSDATQNLDQDLRSNQKTELFPEKTDHTNIGHSNRNEPTPERSFTCGGYATHQQHVSNKTFINPSLLNAHAASHSSQRSFPGGDTLSHSSHLLNQLNSHKVRSPASDSLQHCCPTCGRVCASHSSLVTHIRSHTGEKPFSCRVCGKRFSTNGNCKIHMRVHTGEKPYSCQVCGICFSFHSRFKDHMKVHAGGPELFLDRQRLAQLQSHS